MKTFINKTADLHIPVTFPQKCYYKNIFHLVLKLQVATDLQMLYIVKRYRQVVMSLPFDKIRFTML